jgi:hypothetical protein
MQARYYDSTTGRFLSVDPLKPGVGDTFTLNRYAYVNDNPINDTDSTGEEIDTHSSCAAYDCHTFIFQGDANEGGQSSSHPSGSRAPIYGNAQNSSKTPRHASTSERIANEMSEDPSVKSVHLNQRLSTVTGNPDAPSVQPDVAAVHHNGNIDQVEVISNGQKEQQMLDKMAKSRAGLGVPGRDIAVFQDAPPEGELASEMAVRSLGVIGGVEMIFHAWVDHYVEERENAKLTPAQREYKKECQSRQCI